MHAHACARERERENGRRQREGKRGEDGRNFLPPSLAQERERVRERGGEAEKKPSPLCVLACTRARMSERVKKREEIRSSLLRDAAAAVSREERRERVEDVRTLLLRIEFIQNHTLSQMFKNTKTGTRKRIYSHFATLTFNRNAFGI